MTALSSSSIHFQCDPQAGVWSTREKREEALWLDNVQLSIHYLLNGEHNYLLREPWNVIAGTSPQTVSSPQGPLLQIRYSIAADRHGVACEIVFALAQDQPLLLWQIAIQNQGNQPIQIERIEMLEVGGRGSAAHPSNSVLRFHSSSENLAFFSNGWQSWAYSGVYGKGDYSRRSWLGPIQSPLVVNPGTPQPFLPGHYSSDFFGVLGDRRKRRAVLVGFLSQRQHFGSVEAWTRGKSPRLSMWANGDSVLLAPGSEMSTDWAVLTFVDLDHPDPLANYLEAVQREHGIEVDSSVPIGWCSWYRYYQKVTAAHIDQNLQAMSRVKQRLPLDILQIDDGFESRVGDWSTFKTDFPEGVAPLAHQIREAGLTPGLWLAPFIVHPRARLVQEHPEYLLRDAAGKAVNAGFVWDIFTTALDLTHPGALDYACQAVATAAKDWGFPYLKLDFLYAGALAGLHTDPGLTRAQILRGALEKIREEVGAETHLVGCGVPLGSALGVFDTLRIGSDVSSRWHPSYRGIELIFKHEPHFPSVRNALQNILLRTPMHKRWWNNDPDCLLVRPTARLTLAEVQSLATAIALTGGSLIVSDDLPALPEDRLRLVETLLPLIGQRARVIDWFDTSVPSRLRLDRECPTGPYTLIAQFNWSDRHADMAFDLNEYGITSNKPYFAHMFWTQALYRIDWGMLSLRDIPPHSVLLFALRPEQSGQAQYLGSDLHISQGMEVSAWQADQAGVRVELSLPRYANGQVVMSLPQPPHEVYLDGQSIEWKEEGHGKYVFPVTFNQKAVLEIAY